MTLTEKTIRYYNKHAIDYDSVSEGMTAAVTYSEILKRIRTSNPKTLLDSGCGTGNILTSLINSDIKIWGLDLCQKMVDIAGIKMGRRAEITLGDAHHLPYEDATMECIVCNMSFHHFHEPLKALREMHRVLTPSGTILIGDCDLPFPICKLMNAAVNVIKQRNYIVHSKRELERLFKSCGLEITERTKPSLLTSVLAVKKVN